jgi:hypothetical protein
MNIHSHTDLHDTKYWYTHTKGLRWFNTVQESFVIDWIKLLIYWNIEQWELAVKSLENHDVYGCNYIINYQGNPKHYSGNFWWATSKYIKTLPSQIGLGYNDPEFWVCLNNPKTFNAFSSGLEGMGHYYNPFNEKNYRL